MSPAKFSQFPLSSILSLLKWLKRQISIELPLPTDGAGPRTDDYSRTTQAESACLGFAYTALYITIREEFHWQSSASIQVSLQTCPHIATETHSAGTQRVMKGPWGRGRQRWHQMSLTPCSSPPSTSPSSPEWLLWRCHKTELGKKWNSTYILLWLSVSSKVCFHVTQSYLGLVLQQDMTMNCWASCFQLQSTIIQVSVTMPGFNKHFFKNIFLWKFQICIYLFHFESVLLILGEFHTIYFILSILLPNFSQILPHLSTHPISCSLSL